jgi:hypothetical protein
MPLPSQTLPSKTQKQARQQSSTAANSMSSQLQNYVCRETHTLATYHDSPLCTMHAMERRQLLMPTPASRQHARKRPHKRPLIPTTAAAAGRKEHAQETHSKTQHSQTDGTGRTPYEACMQRYSSDQTAPSKAHCQYQVTFGSARHEQGAPGPWASC